MQVLYHLPASWSVLEVCLSKKPSHVFHLDMTLPLVQARDVAAEHQALSQHFHYHILLRSF